MLSSHDLIPMPGDDVPGLGKFSWKKLSLKNIGKGIHTVTKPIIRPLERALQNPIMRSIERIAAPVVGFVYGGGPAGAGIASGLLRTSERGLKKAFTAKQIGAGLATGAAVGAAAYGGQQIFRYLTAPTVPGTSSVVSKVMSGAGSGLKTAGAALSIAQTAKGVLSSGTGAPGLPIYLPGGSMPGTLPSNYVDQSAQNTEGWGAGGGGGGGIPLPGDAPQYQHALETGGVGAFVLPLLAVGGVVLMTLMTRKSNKSR